MVLSQRWSIPVLLLASLWVAGCDAGETTAPPVDAARGGAVPVAPPPGPLPVHDWNPDDLRVLPEDILAMPGSGKTRLRGKVLDPDGVPVAGAEVQVLALPTASLSGFVPLVHARTTTAADGSFEVGPGPEPWDSLGLLTASVRGYPQTALRSRRFVAEGVASADPDEDVVVRLRRGVRVRGRVRTTSGQPPDGPVRVWAIGYSGTFQRLMTTDSGGAFEFMSPEERVSISAVAGYHPDAIQVIDVKAGAENDVQFVVAEGRDIEGTVVDHETGQPIPGAVLRSFYGETRVVRADGEGRFRLPRYWFRGFQARAPGYAERVHQLTAESGRAGSPPEIVRLLPGIVVRGKVVDFEGQPLAGVRMWCYALSRTGEFVDVSGPLSRPDGTFTFVGIPVPGEGREVRVFSRAHGFAEGTSEPLLSAVRGVLEGAVVRMPRLVRLEGVLKDENGDVWSGRIGVKWIGDAALKPYERVLAAGTSTRARDDGRWAVRAPEQSVLELKVEGAGFRPMETQLVAPSWRSTAAGGGKEPEPTVVKVLRGCTIRGSVVDATGRPVGRGEVRVEPRPPTDPRPPADAWILPDGTFVAAGLDPGKYDISVLVHPEFLQQVVRDLQADGPPVSVRLRRAGGVEGRLVLPGPLPIGMKPRLTMRALEETLPLPARHDVEVDARDLRFAIGPMAPADYSLNVTAGPWRLDVPRIRVQEKDPTQLGDLLLQEGGTLAGTLRSVGVPVAAATVEVFRVHADGRRERMGASTTGEDGTFRVPGLPVGAMSVMVRPRNLPLVEVLAQVEPGTERTVDLEVPPGAEVEVLVQDATGAPVVDARVLFQSEAGSVLFWNRDNDSQGPHTTDGSGVLHATGLVEGELVVRAELAGQGQGEARVRGVSGTPAKVTVVLK